MEQNKYYFYVQQDGVDGVFNRWVRPTAETGWRAWHSLFLLFIYLFIYLFYLYINFFATGRANVYLSGRVDYQWRVPSVFCDICSHVMKIWSPELKLHNRWETNYYLLS